MPKVRVKRGGGFSLPVDFLSRRRFPLHGDYWLDERDGDIILHPCLPDIRKLYIEPTTVCNLHCRTCIRNSWEDAIEHMSMETFAKVVSSLKDLPQLERVIFTSFGEPFSHPHLLDMIAALQDYELKVTVGTNGLMLDPHVARELVRLNVDRVVVSIDGGKPETYTDVRGAMLSNVIDGIHTLNEAKHQLGKLYPAIAIEFVALRSNIDELGELVKTASQLNISRIIISNVLPYTKEMHAEVLFTYEPVPPLKTSGWPLRADAWIVWAIEELPRMHWGAERKCRFVRDHSIVVGWDGGISPCYALSHNYRYFTIDGQEKKVSRYILGNVNHQTLAEAWQSEEYVLFRSEVKAFHFPSCPDCDLRETCDLRQQNKGCWGWEPSCADCLWAQDIIRCP